MSQIKIKFNFFLFTEISNEGLKMCVAEEEASVFVFYLSQIKKIKPEVVRIVGRVLADGVLFLFESNKVLCIM